MARQMKAERERRAEVLSADGEKQAAILRAEGMKQAAILQAEGRKEAAFRDAEARERSAEAEAKDTAMVSEAIAKGDVQAVNYFLGLKYVEAFHALADAGFYRMCVPRAIGGLEVDFPTYVQVLEELAKGDASTAWTVSQGSNWATYGARMAPAARRGAVRRHPRARG